MLSSEALKMLSQKAIEQQDYLDTEEAAKIALVLPFIRKLGYDIFDPAEVVPESTADFADKKGKKVDIAIMHDGKPVILIECKKVSDPLDAGKEEQLGRYFNDTDARFAILTNGIVYKFYSDFNKKGKMDTNPFLEIDLAHLSQSDVDALNKLHLDKSSLDVEKGYDAAEKLKYVGGMKEYLHEMYNQPDKDFVILLARQVYDKKMTQKIRESFTDLVKQAFHEFISDESKKEVKKTLEKASSMNATQENYEVSVTERSRVRRPDDPHEEVKEGRNRKATDQEKEGLNKVRNIVAQIVDQNRIDVRTARSYCTVLLDDNQQKRICRLYFKATNVMRLGLFDEAKKETQHSLKSLDNISDYADQLRATVARYPRK